MKMPDPEGVPRIDVSTEELEALLEQAKQDRCGRKAIKS